ncbi:hypothetical protein V5E97_17990 [Singulisphaera sp. Ch08]|uniref:Lipoprotein n=1 Tax=Singulisphaera sp. Ch08 TaxID=3120278 RepID=A0AAU7CSI5_9BACT
MKTRWWMVVVAIVPLLSEGCGNLEEFPNPESIFESTFNAPPGPSISLLQAYGRGFRDNGACYLRFKASSATFASLTAKGFTPISQADFKAKIRSGSISGPTPSWWNPLKDAPSIFLDSGSFHPTFSSGQAIAAYDPKSQIVNFY